MENDHIKHILEQLESGQLTASDAYNQLKLAPFEDLGYAKVDHHREVRQGAPEVIYGASKTKEQMGGIINSLLSHCKENILITRLSTESAAYLSEACRAELRFHSLARQYGQAYRGSTGCCSTPSQCPQSGWKCAADNPLGLLCLAAQLLLQGKVPYCCADAMCLCSKHLPENRFVHARRSRRWLFAGRQYSWPFHRPQQNKEMQSHPNSVWSVLSG